MRARTKSDYIFRLQRRCRPSKHHSWRWRLDPPDAVRRARQLGIQPNVDTVGKCVRCGQEQRIPLFRRWSQ